MSAKKPDGERLSVDSDAVRELARLIEETGLTEIEIEKSGQRIRVAKQGYAMAAPVAAVAQSSHASAPEKASEAPKKGTVVTSPMVGTVYLGPQPGSPPFVKVGDSVKDDTLCIVEAMKTMNPVAAPVSGRIAEIFVRDGQPVEFGEPLMRIE